jgi:hypothetical protein
VTYPASTRANNGGATALTAPRLNNSGVTILSASRINKRGVTDLAPRRESAEAKLSSTCAH